MSYYDDGRRDARRGWDDERDRYDPPGSPGSEETIEYDYGFFYELGYLHGTINKYDPPPGPNTRGYYDRGWNLGHG